MSPSILAWWIAPQVLATETTTQHYVKDRDVRWTDPWDGAVTESAAGQTPLFEFLDDCSCPTGVSGCSGLSSAICGEYARKLLWE